MRLTPVDHELEDVIAKSTLPRSGGLHISNVYNDLYQDLEPNRYTRGTAPNPYKLAMGLAWETYLEQRLEMAGINAERPGEFVSANGIPFSPDLLIFNGHDRIGEIKLTWMSETDALDDPKFSKWLTQAKAYCHQLEIPFVRFYVLFVNGRGGKGRMPDPNLRAWDIEFSARELQENWQMLMNHAKHKGML